MDTPSLNTPWPDPFLSPYFTFHCVIILGLIWLFLYAFGKIVRFHICIFGKGSFESGMILQSLQSKQLSICQPSSQHKLSIEKKEEKYPVSRLHNPLKPKFCHEQ